MKPSWTQLVALIGPILSLLVTSGVPVHATPGDTTWVRTFDQDFYNWAVSHVDTFIFPDTTVHYNQVVLFYTIGCPEAPADCDPWDRLGHLEVLHETGNVDSLGQPVVEPYEIARIITPYDITGGTRPGTCTWEIDVTDYKTLLQDTVILSNYIESWIGGDDGWLVTIDFAFIEGTSDFEPYKVVNLWQDYYVLYGDPDEPIEEVLRPMHVPIDSEAEAVKVRVVTTGHGQGNTDNCAEFCFKEHTIVVNGIAHTFHPWRDDCNQNPCSPQGGTWQFPRAGWCPGDAVAPWDLDITSLVVPGDTVKLNYNVEPYENLCRPTNPDCVDFVTCADCDYNNTGHTAPHYSVQSQLIFYREGSPVRIGDRETGGTVPKSFALHQNYPNPFNPSTTISFEISDDAGGKQRVSLGIYSMRGRLVKMLVDSVLEPGNHQLSWDGKDESGEAVSSGVYVYSLKTGHRAITRKMLMLK